MSLSCLTQSGQPQTAIAQGYVLTKVSKAGVKYVFQGETDPLETAKGHTIRVARTSLSFCHARIYLDLGIAEGDAAYLNLVPVSDARWMVEPLSRFVLPGAGQ
ncbi:hypothetical protein [Roseibium litorale]|uniref:Uncharacterized protein n=1 Tax=Roseibium litorale TaxID=2803841 RepID=A0ABR9CJB3_9HYPH|nr:hypothetical protein [Roseibium litorale]MBD8890929.1 hypothetical protein [Roseibium litorale]